MPDDHLAQRLADYFRQLSDASSVEIEVHDDFVFLEQYYRTRVERPFEEDPASLGEHMAAAERFMTEECGITG